MPPSAATPIYRTLIDAESLKRLITSSSLVVVDCRHSLADKEYGRRSYAAGHLPDAVFAHIDEDLSGPIVAGKTGRHPLPDSSRFAAVARGWGVSPGVQVVAYDDAAGAMAARLWWLLRYLGHDEVAVLDGGFAAWTSIGGPLVADVPPPRHGTFVPKTHPEMLVTADDVESLRVRSNARLFDARALERYRGDVEPIDPVGGHIPGACPLPFADQLRNGRFRDVSELRTLFDQALNGVPVSESAVYCGSGVTACHVVLGACHVGLDGMRLYAGSWSEWITDPARPVARGS